MNKNSPLIVFVQFGLNPSPTLLHFARIAHGRLSSAKLVLITDLPSSWSDFPGDIVEYSALDRNDSISRLVRRFPERDQISGKYWIYTLERLFALEILGQHYSLTSPLLHIESDNYSFIDRLVLNELQQRCKKLSVPRYSEDLGIASVLFAPSLYELTATIKKFEQILDHTKEWLGDMALLGIALNSGIVDELPTRLSDAWDIDSVENSNAPTKLIFDGLAIGQYLLGQDPYHTNGYAIPGHVNECFTDAIKDWSWKIFSSKIGSNLFVEKGGFEIRIANIHVHSKILIPQLSASNLKWQTIISTANKFSEPIPVQMPDNKIHDTRISLINKFRFARRKGLQHLPHDLYYRVKRIVFRL